MERDYVEGQSIIFVDSHGVPHKALVTRWWSNGQDRPWGCNVVYVSDDKAKTDGYGHQIERATSVVHKGVQAAHGMFWCWPDEV